MSSSKVSSFTSLCLKTIGGILVLTSLLDYLTLAIPFQFSDSQWQISFASQMVDRGIVPMVGISFIVLSYWVESIISQDSDSKGFDLRLPAFCLSLLLGVVFFVLVPLHLNNLRAISVQNLAQIDASTEEAQSLISQRYEQLKNPQNAQLITRRISDIDQALNSGKLEGQTINPQQREQLTSTKQQLEGLSQSAKNPATIDARRQEAQNKLKTETLAQKKRAKSQAVKQGLRVGISSFLLSIGYLLMGWFGLQSSNNKVAKTSNKKSSSR
ncbi:HpsJ family protein [Xenococcus sp. PCC 7305]|uniref:HpsJ family protein n=1 Tax=Xenococcus sp. PCC 7305 TaxID=102125 RepID=UPI00030F60B1|nr:HpsJ family protein [Xenococcus sp. PCC 7305]